MEIQRDNGAATQVATRVAENQIPPLFTDPIFEREVVEKPRGFFQTQVVDRLHLLATVVTTKLGMKNEALATSLQVDCKPEEEKRSRYSSLRRNFFKSVVEQSSETRGKKVETTNSTFFDAMLSREYDRRAALKRFGIAGLAAAVLGVGFENLEIPTAEAKVGIVWECILQNGYEMHGGEAYDLENDVAYGWGNHFNFWFYNNQNDITLKDGTEKSSLNTHIRVFDHPDEGYTEWRMGFGELKEPGGDVDVAQNSNWFEKIVQTKYSDFTNEEGMISLEGMSTAGISGLLFSLVGAAEITMDAIAIGTLAAAVLDIAGTIIDATSGEPIPGAYMAHNTQKSLVQNMKDLYNVSTDSCPANMIP